MKPRGILSALVVVAFLCTLPAVIVYAQSHDHLPDHIMLTPEEMKWSDGPASLPKGAQFTVIEGDLTKEGPFTARFKFPADYNIPPHWHPAIEHVTVIKGSFHMGMGEMFERDKAKKLPVGGFAVMNIGTRHFAFTTEETIVQLHGIGPWGINYVNEEDDPRLAER
jgi:quercetin dioxygenase-like cupin family protein